MWNRELFLLLLHRNSWQPSVPDWEECCWTKSGNVTISVPLCQFCARCPILLTEFWYSNTYQNCSMLYCLLKLCTVLSTLRWAVLSSVDWVLPHSAHFTVRDLVVFVFVSFVFIFFVLYALYYRNLLGVKPNLQHLIFLQCFDGDPSPTWLVGGTPVFGQQTDPVLLSTFSWRVTTMWENHPLKISQLGLLSLSSFQGR